MPQLIEYDQNALLIDVGDTEQLGAALAQLLTDADRRDRLSGAGRWTVETRYRFEQRMRRIREIYDGLLAVPAVNTARLLSRDRGDA